jgi:hypothetical protein
MYETLCKIDLTTILIYKKFRYSSLSQIGEFGGCYNPFVGTYIAS